MKTIYLGRPGFYAQVDDKDYAELAKHSWQVMFRKNGRVYARRTITDADGKRAVVLMHREILGLALGDPRQSDHINTAETLDNRRTNLRIATRSENQCNRRLQANNTCGVKGVRFHKKARKWQSEIQLKGRKYYLGLFLTIEAAKEAYDSAALRLHGDFARLA